MAEQKDSDLRQLSKQNKLTKFKLNWNNKKEKEIFNQWTGRLQKFLS